MVVQELVTLLGFDIDDKNLKEFNKGLADATKNAARLAAGVVAAGVAVFSFIKTSANAADNIIKLSAAAGTSVEELQRLKFAAEINKTTLEALRPGLSILTKQLGEALTNSSSAAAKKFDELNISVRGVDGSAKTTYQVMLELADAIEGTTSAAQKSSMAQALMGEAGAHAVQLLSQGATEIERLGDEIEGIGGVLSREQMESLEDFNDTVTRTTGILTGIKNVIASEIAPEMTELLKQFVDFVKANRDLIKDNVLGLFKALSWWFSIAARSIGILAGGVLKLTDALGGSERWAKALLLVFSIIASASVVSGFLTLITVVKNLGNTFLVAWAKALLPVTAVVALVAGLVLLIEDLWLGMQGVEKTFFNFFKETVGPYIQELYNGFLKLEEIIANLFSRFSLPAGLTSLIDRARDFMWPGQSPSGVTPSNSPVNNTSNASNVRVEAPITVNVPAGTDPSVVGEKVESGVSSGVEKILRQTGRVSLPSGGY